MTDFHFLSDPDSRDSRHPVVLLEPIHVQDTPVRDSRVRLSVPFIQLPKRRVSTVRAWVGFLSGLVAFAVAALVLLLVAPRVSLDERLLIVVPLLTWVGFAVHAAHRK